MYYVYQYIAQADIIGDQFYLMLQSSYVYQSVKMDVFKDHFYLRKDLPLEYDLPEVIMKQKVRYTILY